ncbi:hypothetical protein FHT67_004019 [Paenibacillus sp. BK720]|nr:hypothetical protein [Paenibacillus sp. BK720]
MSMKDTGDFGGLAILRGTHDFASQPRGWFAFSVHRNMQDMIILDYVLYNIVNCAWL